MQSRFTLSSSSVTRASGAVPIDLLANSFPRNVFRGLRYPSSPARAMRCRSTHPPSLSHELRHLRPHGHAVLALRIHALTLPSSSIVACAHDETPLDSLAILIP
jgi:hypothetical protein